MADTLEPRSDRVLLARVPRLAFYSGGPRCPEDVCFPSSLRALLEYLRELPGCRHLSRHQAGSPIHCGYAWLMGFSGQAFATVWEPGWSPGNVDPRHIAADPAQPFRLPLEAVGRPGQVLLRGADWPAEDTLRRSIIASVDAGLPAISLGLASPSEAGLVTGYDEGGAALMGWSFFQDFDEFRAGLSFEPTGEYRLHGWYDALEGLILPGARVDPPPLRESVQRGLRAGLEHIHTAAIRGRATGLAAYDAWAEQLLHDEEFEGATPDEISSRLGAHDNAVGNLAELRWYGSVFLSQAASSEMARDAPLLRAAACMTEEHALMWKAWGLVGGPGRDDRQVAAFATPEVRRGLAEVLRASRERCACAADELERALA